MYNMPENPKIGLVLQIPSHPRRISFASRRAANLPRCVYLISHAEMSKRRTQRRENTHPGEARISSWQGRLLLFTLHVIEFCWARTRRFSRLAEVVSYFAVSPCAVSSSPLLQPHFIFVIISSVMGSLVTRVSI